MTEHVKGVETDHRKIVRLATKKRKRHEFQTVTRGAVIDYEDLGWEVDKELKKQVRMKRELPLDKFLENRVWLLLFMMGFPELGGGNDFKIRIHRKGAEPLHKHIDAFAKDDETVLVFECKASEKMKKRSLQKDIEEFANLKGPISSSIKAHYGREYKPKNNLDICDPQHHLVVSAESSPLCRSCPGMRSVLPFTGVDIDGSEATIQTGMAGDSRSV